LDDSPNLNPPTISAEEAFNSRLSGRRVREFVEFIYLSEYTLSERISCAKRKSSNPYPASFGALDRMPWDGEIICGHNPFLFARRVDDLKVERGSDGKESATWTEVPKPDVAWMRNSPSTLNPHD
jgi:hypothetical protein